MWYLLFAAEGFGMYGEGHPSDFLLQWSICAAWEPLTWFGVLPTLFATFLRVHFYRSSWDSRGNFSITDRVERSCRCTDLTHRSCSTLSTELARVGLSVADSWRFFRRRICSFFKIYTVISGIPLVSPLLLVLSPLFNELPILGFVSCWEDYGENHKDFWRKSK